MAPRGGRRGPGGSSSNGLAKGAGRPGSQDPDLELDAAAESALRLRELADQAARAPKVGAAELPALLAAAAEGDGRARSRLFDANLEMVIRQAAARAGRGLSVEDLVQEGSVGLVAAIAGNDGAKPFAKAAEGAVASAMEAALAAEVEAAAELGRLVEDAETYERAELVVARLLGRVPEEAELAEKLEWTVERTRAMGVMVAEARRKHDEELLAYVDPATLGGDEEDDDA